MCKGTCRSCNDCLQADIVDGVFNDCLLTAGKPVGVDAMLAPRDRVRDHSYYFIGVITAVEALDAWDELPRIAARNCDFWSNAKAYYLEAVAEQAAGY